MSFGLNEKIIEFNNWAYEKMEPRLGKEISESIAHRAVLHGLPLAVITSVAAARFSGASNASTAALFGTVSYLTFTLVGELYNALWVRATDDEKQESRTTNLVTALTVISSILLISSVAAGKFVKMTLKSPLSYRAMGLLTLAAGTGQLFKELCIDQKALKI